MKISSASTTSYALMEQERESQEVYDNHLHNALWAMVNAKRMAQRLRRLSQGPMRDKYDRLAKRIAAIQEELYGILLDIFETEDDPHQKEHDQ